MTAREVTEIIEEWAPLSIQESWDNAGFHVGHPQTKVKGVLLSLDVTPSVLKEALALGANLVISHHPLIFKSLKQLCGQDQVACMVEMAIKKNLVIYSSHTNVDKVATGVSGLMAEMLHLKDIEILNRDKEELPVGLGIVGNLPEPLETSFFLTEVKRLFHLSSLRASCMYIPLISRVSVCGGSGSLLIQKAMESGSDIFLSGDISYHHYFNTEGKMILADIGHYESEIAIVSKMAHILWQKNLTFAVSISKTNTNPIHYY